MNDRHQLPHDHSVSSPIFEPLDLRIYGEEGVADTTLIGKLLEADIARCELCRKAVLMRIAADPAASTAVLAATYLAMLKQGDAFGIGAPNLRELSDRFTATTIKMWTALAAFKWTDAVNIARASHSDARHKSVSEVFDILVGMLLSSPEPLRDPEMPASMLDLVQPEVRPRVASMELPDGTKVPLLPVYVGLKPPPEDTPAGTPYMHTWALWVHPDHPSDVEFPITETPPALHVDVIPAGGGVTVHYVIEDNRITFPRHPG